MNATTKKKSRIRSKRTLCFLALVCCLVSFAFPAWTQTEKSGEEAKIEVPTVFIECETCDIPFIQQNIPFVRLVQSVEEAEILIRISEKSTETGDILNTISFIGQQECTGDDDELTYTVEKGKTAVQVKQERVDRLKMGLMRYVGKTPLCDQISIKFMEEVKPTDVEDPWNFWVFSLSANTFLNGEQVYKSGSYYGSFSANRVTEDWKIRSSVRASYHKSTFTFDDEDIESSSESFSFSGLVVKSISDHWSVGAYISASSSSYSNTRFSLTPAPAIEFNLFPYSESTKKELRFLYRIGYTSVRYREETIYKRTSENRWKQDLSIILEVKQKWGTASMSLRGSNYFHDFKKNRLNFSGELSFRLIKGLNFNVGGRYSRIRDQISLASAGATLEEILLRRKELETGYSYSISVGLSFTFGSTKSKIVNPRFGSGGTSISISF